MRILCLTSRLPYPPYSGDRLRVFHFIERLAADHEVSLASFIASPEEQDCLAPLRELCREVRVVLLRPQHSLLKVASNLWRPLPLQVLYYRSRAMRQVVTAMLASREFDVVYSHLCRMAPYGIEATQRYRIVDMTNVLSQELQTSLPYRGRVSQAAAQQESARMARYEQWLANQVDELWLISEAERRTLAAVCPHANVQVVTNGVDPKQFFPTGQSCDTHGLLFVGNFHAFPNQDAAGYLAREILPRVRQAMPDSTLTLAGVNVNKRIRRLAHAPGVTVIGETPDLNDALNRAAVVVAPLRTAGGIQNKVLEALAAGRPVVTSSIVNRGLAAVPERDLLIADDAETTAGEIIRLFRDEELRKRLGRAGRAFVRGRHTWEEVAQRMKAIEEDIAQHVLSAHA